MFCTRRVIFEKQILAVCDPETEYTRRFCDYIGKKGEYPFEAAAFTSIERLEKFCEEEPGEYPAHC